MIENVYLISHAKTSQKRAGIATLISEKADFRAKDITRDEEVELIRVKELNYWENITIVNVCPPGDQASIYTEQALVELNWHLYICTVVFGKFISFSIIYKLIRQ